MADDTPTTLVHCLFTVRPEGLTHPESFPLDTPIPVIRSSVSTRFDLPPTAFDLVLNSETLSDSLTLANYSVDTRGGVTGIEVRVSYLESGTEDVRVSGPARDVIEVVVAEAGPVGLRGGPRRKVAMTGKNDGFAGKKDGFAGKKDGFAGKKEDGDGGDVDPGDGAGVGAGVGADGAEDGVADGIDGIGRRGAGGDPVAGIDGALGPRTLLVQIVRLPDWDRKPFLGGYRRRRRGTGAHVPGAPRSDGMTMTPGAAGLPPRPPTSSSRGAPDDKDPNDNDSGNGNETGLTTIAGGYGGGDGGEDGDGGDVVEYHHASSQTPSQKQQRRQQQDGADARAGARRERNHRDTQTVEMSQRSTQSNREAATQMGKPGLYIDDDGAKVLHPGAYTTAEEVLSERIAKAVRIQCFIRGWFARRTATRRRDELERRRCDQEDADARLREEADEKRRAEVERRMRPRGAADFAVLHEELESWRASETQRIKQSDLPPAEKKAALALLLNKETRLLQTIDRLKIQANGENRDERIARLLELMSAPKKWQMSDGTVAEVETPFTMRAKELMDLYNGLRLPLLGLDERLDVLLHVKWTVKEFDCNLTREIVELIDREADMLNRGRTERALAGLRRRLSNLFLQFIQTPEFNPEAVRFQKVPKDLLQAAGMGLEQAAAESEGRASASVSRASRRTYRSSTPSSAGML